MRQQPASLLLRTPAFLFDQCVVLLLVVGPTIAVGIELQTIISPGEIRQTVFLILMAVAFVYHLIFEWATGQTPGKWLFGLRVVRTDGGEIGFSESVLRNAFRLIDGLGYWSVAVAIILFRGDGKRLGDVLGNTLVVET